MLRTAFDCEPGRHTRDLAFRALKFPSYRMPWASTDVPAMMLPADAVVAVAAAVAAAADGVQCLHFAAVVGDDVAAAAVLKHFKP